MMRFGALILGCVAAVACVPPGQMSVDAGPDLSTFVQKGGPPVYMPRDLSTRYLNRFLLCGDGFLVWNEIGHIEIGEARHGDDAVVTATIDDTTPHLSESGFTWGQLSGTRLILIDAFDIVHVYDLSDHSNPKLLGSFPGFPGYPRAFKNLLLYATANSRQGDGYQVVDITDPNNPVFGQAHKVREPRPTFSPQNGRSFEVLGDRVFLVDGTGTQLFEMDMTDPLNPKPKAVARSINDSTSVGFLYDRFIGNTSSQGWKVIDVHEPWAPQVVIDGNILPYEIDQHLELQQTVPIVRSNTLFMRGWQTYKDEYDPNIGGHQTPIVVFSLEADGTAVPHGGPLPLPHWPEVTHNVSYVDDLCWDGKVLTLAGDRITFWTAR